VKSVLLDTNAYVAFKQGNKDVLNILQHADSIGISTIVLGELIAGFTFGSKTKQNLQALQEFLKTPRIKMLPVDEVTATFYAHTYTHLRNKGKSISTNDLWIAAIALQYGYKLCSFDVHFKAVENLIVATTLEEFMF
jgi:tRNA(fMet)-specific endonuclease VapC